MAIEYPALDKSRACLERSGWSVAETAAITPQGLRWRVSGVQGEFAVRAEGESQAEAWYRACKKAHALGLLSDLDKQVRRA
jgi:hypothetical protein